MANIQGTNVAAAVVPFTTEDIYATHEAKYGKGGWRSVAAKADLATIPVNRLEEGMSVYVIADKQMYIYEGLENGERKWTTPIATQAGVDLEILATKEYASGEADAAEAAAKAYADSLAPNYDAAGTATTEIGKLDVANEGEVGSFIEQISETDGKISATKKAFASSVTENGTVAPSAAAVYAHVLQATAALAGATHFRGVVQSLPADTTGYSDGDIIIVGTKEYICSSNAWVQLGDEAAWDPVGSAASAETAAKNYADSLASNYDAAGTAAAAVQALDVAEVGQDGSYIKKVSEADGKVSATVQAFAGTVTNDSTNAPTSAAVKTYVDNAVQGVQSDFVTVKFYKDSVADANLIAQKTVHKGDSVEWPALDYNTQYLELASWSIAEEDLVNIQQDTDVIYQLVLDVVRFYQYGNYGDDYENYVYRSDAETSEIEIDGTTYYVAMKEVGEDTGWGILIDSLTPDTTAENYVPYAIFYEDPTSLQYEEEVSEKHWIYKVEYGEDPDAQAEE